MPPKKIKDPKDVRKRIISVKVNASEFDQIQGKAQKFGFTTSTYLRSLAMNYPVKSIVDEQAVSALLKSNADLGRLGGLFKMWLTHNEGEKGDFSAQRSYQNIDQLVDEIQAVQKVLKAEALKIMNAK